jgi:hypothetical protein
MTVGTVKTQGTELFFVDNSTTDGAELIKLLCPTGISGLGGAADQIEDTCLEAREDKTYVRGLGNPGQVSVPFNLIPRAGSHQILFDLKATGDTIGWMVCLSEGTTAPTVDTDEAMVAPSGRTSLAFQAYIADVNIDIATNTIVKGTLTLQRSGPVVANWYTPS